MTQHDLQHWVDLAYGGPLASSTVAWVAAENPHGWEMGRQWIDSPKPAIAVAGWATLSSLVSIKHDDELDQAELKNLLQRVQRSIHQADDRVRRLMNGFVAAVGSYVAPLTKFALQIGEQIGPVTADVGDTNCSVPFSPDQIRKVEARGSIGKKRKTAKC